MDTLHSTVTQLFNVHLTRCLRVLRDAFTAVACSARGLWLEQHSWINDSRTGKLWHGTGNVAVALMKLRINSAAAFVTTV